MAENKEQDEPAGAGTGTGTKTESGAGTKTGTKTAAKTGGSHELDASAPFVTDIMIWTDGLERPRKLTQEALQELPEVPDSLMPTLNELIKQGVALAAIPSTSGIGAACYLVNLAALRRPDKPDEP